MHILVLFLSLFVSQCYSTITEEDGVLVLNKDNFQDAITKYEYILVEFYAPWCGHCKALAPEYKKAAEILKNEGSNIKLAKVDATVEKELASEHHVSGYPTIKYFRHRQPVEFRGGRDAESIISWCKKKMGPAVYTLETSEDVKKLIASEKILVLGFFKDSEKENIKVFEGVANSMDETAFALVQKQAIFDEYGVSKSSHVILFKNFDEGQVDFDGTNFEALPDFVRKESVPLVSEFSQETSAVVFGSPIKKHFVVFLSRSKSYDSVKSDLRSVAKTFKGKIHVMIIDVDVEDHQRILEFFGLEKSDTPTYRLIDLAEEMIKFKPDSSDMSVSVMSAFIQDCLDGKRKPFLMSQEVPAPSDEPVRVLVGKNYNEVTRDRSKAVFVELYAPWCGHCKALAPVWEELGKAFKGHPDIIIAKMDATTNEAENLKIASFPTIKFYPKDSDEEIDYSGERTFEALKKFVESGGKVVSDGTDKPKEEQKDEL